MGSHSTRTLHGTVNNTLSSLRKRVHVPQARLRDAAEDVAARGETTRYGTLTAVELARTLFPKGQQHVVFWLTNLAVAPECRRSGLARQLCECCEEWGQQWGLDGTMMTVLQACACPPLGRTPWYHHARAYASSSPLTTPCPARGLSLLQVEEQNFAAISLYHSLGYRTLWVDEEATALRLTPGGASAAASVLQNLQIAKNDALLQSEPTKLVTMAKQIVAEVQVEPGLQAG